jgi:hypothetical protein
LSAKWMTRRLNRGVKSHISVSSLHIASKLIQDAHMHGQQAAVRWGSAQQ